MIIINDLLSLVYPNNCRVCGNSLFRREKIICMRCYHHLPKAGFTDDIKSPVAQVFWGRVPMNIATVAYLYNKGNAVQKLIHDFKYRGFREIGIFLGEELGKEILSSEKSMEIDYIIPVPLHRKKIKKRGFNQSEIIAKGVSVIIHKETNTRILRRSSFSATQTKKSKYDRWQNVESIFSVDDENSVKGKHLLLIDDVITTGATIEACAQVLLKIEGVKLSVGAAAYTR